MRSMMCLARLELEGIERWRPFMRRRKRMSAKLPIPVAGSSQVRCGSLQTEDGKRSYKESIIETGVKTAPCFDFFLSLDGK